VPLLDPSRHISVCINTVSLPVSTSLLYELGRTFVMTFDVLIRILVENMSPSLVPSCRLCLLRPFFCRTPPLQLRLV